MQLLFYDHRDLEAALGGSRSVFLAGPTVRGRGRTPWRARAIELFTAAGYDGTLVIPEFEARRFEDAAPAAFGHPPSPVSAMRDASYNILAWETCGLERTTLVLFWMPFSIAAEEDPASLPGFTTRAEVSRELVRTPARLVLGMPAGALSSSHVRYHAHHAGLAIHPTLEATVAAALAHLGAAAPAR